MHLTDHLDWAARNHPERLAFDGAGGPISYREARSAVARIARGLIAHGFPVGTPFAVLSPNDGRTLVTMLGAMRAGGAWCNVNLGAAVEANVDILRRGRCEVLCFHSAIADKVPAFAAGIDTLRLVLCIDSPDHGYPSLESWSRAYADDPPELEIPLDAVGCQGSTGGTTGASKVTQASNQFMLMSTLAWASCWHFDAPPVNLAIAPITHAGGMIALAQLQFAGTTVLMDVPDIARVPALIAEHRVTTLFLPPTLIYRLLAVADLDDHDLSSLRYLISAAAPIAPERITGAVERLGPVMCQAYGQTEAGFPLSWMSPAETAAAVAAGDTKRLLSCGRPTLIGPRMEAMDPDGNILPPGEVGEIVVRGPTTMLRYVGDPDATAAVQAHGWHHTGDVGHRDADGYLYITDRIRDMIISGGFNVFPFEVEQALLGHPAVQDCAVIGIPSDEWGEQVHACVELRPGSRPTEAELIAHCKQTIGSIKAPKSIEYIPDLPRSPVGKVLKRELRDPHWTAHTRAVI